MRVCNLYWICIVLLLVGIQGAQGAQADGLVGYWNFDEGSGDAVRDSSGTNNHGTIHSATYVKQGKGQSLLFDGETSFVEIGANPSLDIGSSGTISLWIKPEKYQGALFSWGSNSESEVKIFVPVFETRTGWGTPGNELRLWMSSARRYQRHAQPLTDPQIGEWNHIVFTVNDRQIMCYRNGAPDMEITMPFNMDLSDRPLLIGKYIWKGKQVFKGLIDEVRVYDRPLSRSEVRDYYRNSARYFGKDAALFDRPKIDIQVLSDPGRIAVSANCALMNQLDRNATIDVSLRQADAKKTLASGSQQIDPSGRRTNLNLDVTQILPGTYEIHAVVKSADGRKLGQPSVTAVTWPGQTSVFKNVRILNNLVWELINEKPGSVAGVKQYTFTQPKRRWIYVTCTADAALSISIDDEEDTRDIIVFDGSSNATQEAMRFLPAGEHTIKLITKSTGRVGRLIVRSIPALIFPTLLPKPHITPHGPYEAEFMRKYIAPHVNTFITAQSNNRPRIKEPFFKEIVRGGNHHILAGCLVPRKVDDKPITVEQAYDYLAKTQGMSHPDFDGAMADEFGGSREHCAVYAQAWRKLSANTAFKDKVYFPYVGRLYTGADGLELVDALIDTNSAFAIKRYLKIRHTEQASYDYAYRSIISDISKYRSYNPRSIEHMAVCFGYLNAPPEFLNVVPHANYKSYLDMQFNIVANLPELWGTYGLMSYLAHYSDEETNRWIVHLFRHYGIEGNTRRASDDPFDDSRHLANGDFNPDMRSWKLSPAAPNSIRQVEEIHFGWLQGRYQYTPIGDLALMMIRNADKPNTISQQIKNLEPGRLYTFRMITGEYEDMLNRKANTVDIKIKGAQIVPGRSFNHLFHNSYAHNYGKYSTEQHAWMTYHWVLFRAQSSTATLSVSDWEDNKQPGGRIGQKMMLNFLQVHPYFEQ